MKLIKTAGYEKQAQIDLDTLYQQHQMQGGKEGTVYVSVYETERAYGGPEEGGWWFDVWTLDSSKPFTDRAEAESFAEALRNGIEETGVNDEPLSSSRGFDQYPDANANDPMHEPRDEDIPVGFSGLARNYSVVVEDIQGENATTERPHYE